jgi:phage tail sheath gpL-like
MIGQRNAAAPIAAGVPTLVTSLSQAETYFGVDSQIAQMARVWFANNTVTPLTVCALDDNGSGVTASGSIAFTGPATAAGVLSVYIGGQLIQVGVTSGMTAAQLATALYNAVNAVATCPVVATNGTAGTCTLTCNWKGETGNDIDIRLNYSSGDATPAGIAATVTAMASGATNPAISAAITAIGDVPYNVIINPFTDSTNLGLLKTEMDRRAGPILQSDGMVFMAKSATTGSLATFGNAQNSQWFSSMGVYKMPSPAYEMAAGVAAVAAYYGSIDQARPFQTLPIAGIYAPAISDQFLMTDQDVLLHDGISTYKVDSDGTVRIQRLITMYQTNPAGAVDVSYLDVNTMLTLSYLRYSTRNMILSKYPRHKLADDGIRYNPSQAVVTPKLMKAELIALCSGWVDLGLVEGLDDFKAGLIVERNATDRNRLDILITPNLMNQFMIAGVQIRFIL